MPRTIKINTDDLWDAALRYERLGFNVEDISTALRRVGSELREASSQHETTHNIDELLRKTDDLLYRLQDLCGKLRFAATRYEDYDRHIKQSINEN
jgi:hypothetical protein